MLYIIYNLRAPYHPEATITTCFVFDSAYEDRIEAEKVLAEKNIRTTYVTSTRYYLGTMHDEKDISEALKSDQRRISRMQNKIERIYDILVEKKDDIESE